MRMAEAKEEKKSIEELLGEIEETARSLSEDDLALEEAFALYESGVKKVRECQSAVEDVEKKMLVLTEDGNTEEFDG